jgi:hypothetical protein
MKKIYLSILSIVAFNAANAQLTLTKAANEPVSGNSYNTVGLDTSNALPNTVTGNAVTWNITGVSTNTVSATNTYTVASAIPSASSYTGTTLVESSATDTTFWKSTASTFEITGVKTAQFNLNYSNTALAYQWPVTYTTSVSTDPVAGTLSAQGQSGTFTGTLNTIADGAGTLNINSTVSLSNALRVKSVQNINFTLSSVIQGTITQTFYNYYHSSSKYPILSVQYVNVVVPAASINQTTTSVNLNSVIVLGINEKSMNNIIFTAYPNPATENVSLHFVLTNTESYNVEVVNTLGQTVKQVALNNLQPGMYNEQVDLSGLNKGIYFVKVKGTHAEGIQKIIVQ